MQLDFIDHFAISVKNLQTSFDWYHKIFGFEKFHEWKTTWLIQLGSMKIGLFERPNAAAIDDLDNKIAFQHLAFHVSFEQFIVAEIELGNLGIQFEGPEDTGVAYSIFLNDPDGHLLELTTYYGQQKLTDAVTRESCAPRSAGQTSPQTASRPQRFQRKVPLAGSERHPLATAREVGAISPDEQISVSVYVRSKGDVPHPQVAGAESPQDRRYLTHEELMSQFAADPADLALVEEFARAHNLTVVESSPEKRSVKLTGMARDMSRAFEVELRRYERRNGKQFRGRTGQLSIPSELNGIVEAVFGLDNRKMARSYVRSRGLKIPHDNQAALPPGSFFPPDLAKIYAFPPNTTGAGQVIGILTFNDAQGLGGYDAAALDVYFKQVLKMAAAPNITNVVVAGPGNVPSSSNDPDNSTGEVMLDVQVTGAMAPGARLVMYFSEFTEQGWVDVLHTVVADAANNISVLSISYGNPEDAEGSAWTKAAITQVNKAFSAAAAKGITICCASGDDGSRDQAQDSLPHADYPASDPFVLGVGGTTVTAASGEITSEKVWNDREGIGGGGISAIFGVPNFQSHIAFLKKPVQHKKGRGVPDVAADADPETGFLIIEIDAKTLDSAGGTSASAPLWAALIARLNQALGARIGYFNPLLYQKFATGVLHDITEGNIGAYKAAKGWDPCTGLGTPDGSKLLSSLKK